MERIKYFSMFSGVGGFELGIERAWTGQAECVGYCEIDKPAVATYEKNFKGHRNYEDATKIDTGRLPDFDLLVGGFPCQAFSVAGKRKGFDDTRGTLFFDLARICAEKRPRHLVLENVKGLLTHKSGETFQTILRVLADLGYRVEWQLLNSKGFGVPQSRERIYIIGHLRTECGRKILPIASAEGGRIQEVTTGAPQAKRLYNAAGVAPTLSGGGVGGGRREAKVCALTEVRTEEAKAIRRESQKTGRDFSPRRGKYLVARADNVVGTLTSSRNFENMLLDHGQPRLMTPREYERAQGFPDDWTVGSDTQRYRQMGNAVTINVVEAVMKKLKEH